MSGDKDAPKKPPEWRSDKPLGKALRDRYKEVLNEPVPEKLKKLIFLLVLSYWNTNYKVTKPLYSVKSLRQAGSNGTV